MNNLELLNKFKSGDIAVRVYEHDKKKLSKILKIAFPKSKKKFTSCSNYGYYRKSSENDNEWEGLNELGENKSSISITHLIEEWRSRNIKKVNKELADYLLYKLGILGVQNSVLKDIEMICIKGINHKIKRLSS